jgi:hypothetical protein
MLLFLTIIPCLYQVIQVVASTCLNFASVMVQQAAIGLIGWKLVAQSTQQQFRGVADVYILVS